MVGLDRRPRHLLGKQIDTEKSEADRVYNAALTLPVLSKDIVLAWHELKFGTCERAEVR